MTWNPDAPAEMLDRASRVFWELCGPAPYMNWLQKEVSRTKVHLEYQKAVVFSASAAGGAREPQQAVPPTAATGVASIDPHIVDEMVDVLRWYADRRNYRNEDGRQPIDTGDSCPVLDDDGSRASHVVNKFDINRMGT